MRERPIPWAYRVFFRQIGLDPDQTRTPVEQLALDRLHDGAFVSRGLPADALTIATVETGVALRVFDLARIEGELCIRDSAPGESLPGKPAKLAQGTLTIADERGAAGAALRRSGRRSRARSGGESHRDRRGAGKGSAPGRRRRGALDRQRGDRGLSARSHSLTGSSFSAAAAVIYTRFRSYAGSTRSRHAHDASSGRRRAPRARGAAPPDRPPRARARPPLRRGLPASPARYRDPGQLFRAAGGSGSRSSSGFATRSPIA